MGVLLLLLRASCAPRATEVSLPSGWLRGAQTAWIHRSPDGRVRAIIFNWRDTRTELELVRSPTRSVSTVYGRLQDRTEAGR